MGKTTILNKEIVLTDWDWPNETGPNFIEAIVTTDYGKDKYEISLSVPLTLPDGSTHRKLIIQGRHQGFSVTKIIPSFFQSLFIFKHPLSKLFSPLVAVNVYTTKGLNFSIACAYLKSVYLKATGKR